MEFSYWDNNGKYQETYNRFLESLVPVSGSSEFIEGEHLRAVVVGRAQGPVPRLGPRPVLREDVEHRQGRARGLPAVRDCAKAGSGVPGGWRGGGEAEGPALGVPDPADDGAGLGELGPPRR